MPAGHHFPTSCFSHSDSSFSLTPEALDEKPSPRGHTHLLPTEKRATTWPGSLSGNSSLFDITVFKI